MPARLSEHDKERLGAIILKDYGDWFSAQLMRLIAKSDPDNKALIRSVFPDHVEAYEPSTNEPAPPDMPTWDATLAGCHCTQTPYTDAMRDRHGISLHAPWCPVGIRERTIGYAEFSPFGTEVGDE